MEDTLKKFKDYLRKMEQYKEAAAIFSWDLQTAAPKGSIESKINDIGFFSTEIFRLSTSDEYGEMLKELSKPEDFRSLDEAMRLTVTRYSRDYKRFKRMPEDFFLEYTMAKARSEKAWEKAREADDFSIFEPHLDKVIKMTKEAAGYMEPGKDAYNVLVDMFEEGMDTDSLDKIFDEVKTGLAPLIEKISEKDKPDLSAFKGYYDKESQKKAQDFLLGYIGFDFDRGTTGQSAHPFTTTLCQGDVRITNHFYETDPLDAMFSAIHEGGHAIFEQNIDSAYAGTAAGEVGLMGLHESQSRFFENILGRNINFWIPIYDKIGGFMPQFKKIPIDTFNRAINMVKPGPVRLQADEVTYCMHIILRYELEKAIFRGGISAAELPALWNKKTKELLGIAPAGDREGVLQDMHWSDGSFGYFPSYLLGSVYDGMILEEIEKELGSMDVILAEGRIKEAVSWLNGKIHRFGSLYSSKEVLHRVCRRELTAQPLLKYFEDKYTKIYSL